MLLQSLAITTARRRTAVAATKGSAGGWAFCVGDGDPRVARVYLRMSLSNTKLNLTAFNPLLISKTDKNLCCCYARLQNHIGKASQLPLDSLPIYIMCALQIPLGIILIRLILKKSSSLVR